MRNEPQGESLLAEAIRTLNTHIIPTLTSENRYQALMALRALELVRQELLADSNLEKNIDEHLKQLLNVDDHVTDSLMIASERIRKGDFDFSENMYELLRNLVTYKLMETNPNLVTNESKYHLIRNLRGLTP